MCKMSRSDAIAALREIKHSSVSGAWDSSIADGSDPRFSHTRLIGSSRCQPRKCSATSANRLIAQHGELIWVVGANIARAPARVGYLRDYAHPLQMKGLRRSSQHPANNFARSLAGKPAQSKLPAFRAILRVLLRAPCSRPVGPRPYRRRPDRRVRNIAGARTREVRNIVTPTHRPSVMPDWGIVEDGAGDSCRSARPRDQAWHQHRDR